LEPAILVAREKQMKLVAVKWVAVLLCAAVSAVVGAQETGGVVRGNTNINVRAANVNTMAVGSNNIAKTSIGSIKGGSSGGNVTVDVKNVTNIVGGHGKKGCVNIGSRGTDPECK
jgi:hypothetical protein